jgi:hypothetical protein
MHRSFAKKRNLQLPAISRNYPQLPASKPPVLASRCNFRLTAPWHFSFQLSGFILFFTGFILLFKCQRTRRLLAPARLGEGAPPLTPFFLQLSGFSFSSFLWTIPCLDGKTSSYIQQTSKIFSPRAVFRPKGQISRTGTCIICTDEPQANQEAAN